MAWRWAQSKFPVFSNLVRLKVRQLRHHAKFFVSPKYPANDIENYLGHFFPSLKLGESSLVIDLGANEGWFSLVAGKQGSKVIGFEPNTWVAQRAQKRVALFPNVLIVNAAVGRSTGFERLFFPPNYLSAPELFSGSASLVEDNIAIDSANFSICFSLSFEALMENIERIDLLKVDIEGSEQMLWPTIERNFQKIDFLAIETHEDLLGTGSGWIAGALKFIEKHGLQESWRLDWP